MNNTLSTQEAKWYSKPPFTFTGFIVFAFVVFFPLGVFLLWKSNKIKVGWKIAFTIVGAFFGLMVMVAIFAPNTPEMIAQQRREDSLAHIKQLRNDSVETDKKQNEIALKKQNDIETANKAELSKEPRIINSIVELKQRFNDFAASLTNSFTFRISNQIKNKKIGNTHIFKYAFDNNFLWMGTFNETDNSIKEIAMIVSGDENNTRTENAVLLLNTVTMMEGIIATADPTVNERGDILKRMGIFDKDKKITNMQAQVIQNGIRYWIVSSPEMGISFGADLKDLQ